MLRRAGQKGKICADALVAVVFFGFLTGSAGGLKVAGFDLTQQRFLDARIGEVFQSAECLTVRAVLQHHHIVFAFDTQRAAGNKAVKSAHEAVVVVVAVGLDFGNQIRLGVARNKLRRIDKAFFTQRNRRIQPRRRHFACRIGRCRTVGNKEIQDIRIASLLTAAAAIHQRTVAVGDIFRQFTALIADVFNCQKAVRFGLINVPTDTIAAQTRRQYDFGKRGQMAFQRFPQAVFIFVAQVFAINAPRLLLHGCVQILQTGGDLIIAYHRIQCLLPVHTEARKQRVRAFHIREQAFQRIFGRARQCLDGGFSCCAFNQSEHIFLLQRSSETVFRRP